MRHGDNMMHCVMIVKGKNNFFIVNFEEHPEFAEYASTAKHKYLKQVYESVPRMVGQRYKYSRVNPDFESTFLKDALQLLCKARCLTRICHSSGAGLPLSASVNEKKFKVACLDICMIFHFIIIFYQYLDI